MTEAFKGLFQLAAFIGDELVEREPPPASELLAMLRRGEVWGDACICPKAGDFPRVNVSFHHGHGFVIQCYEDQQARSDFLVAADTLSPPSVDIEHGGQAMERWPPELFVAEPLAKEALEYFLARGKQKSNLRWVRIDQFPRQTVWEGRREREAWEKSMRSRDQSDA